MNPCENPAVRHFSPMKKPKLREGGGIFAKVTQQGRDRDQPASKASDFSTPDLRMKEALYTSRGSHGASLHFHEGGGLGRSHHPCFRGKARNDSGGAAQTWGQIAVEISKNILSNPWPHFLVSMFTFLRFLHVCFFFWGGGGVILA